MQVEKQDAVPAVEATQAAPEAPEITSEAPATTENTGNDDEPQPQSDKSDGVQKRISELTKKRREAERRAVEAERRLAEISQERPKEPASTEKPKIGDFENYDEYVEALTDWKAGQAISQREQKSTAEREKSAQAEQQRDLQARVDAQIGKGVAKFADFEEKVLANPDLAITPSMVEAIAELDEGADVAYYLADHPEEAASIAAMPPLRQAVALGRIESKLASTPPAKKVTGAPAPVASKVNGGGSPTTKDPSKMTDAEWFAAERAKRTRQ